MNIETDFYSPAKFADFDIFHCLEGPIKKAVCGCYIADYFEKARNADKSIDFLALKLTGNLDFEIVVNFACCVT